MMFHSHVLRVVLATVHVPLAEVPRVLTGDRLEATIRLTAAELPRFGYASPRLALAGLNPHAGEGGLMGEEDARVLAPVVASCREDGIDIVGPLPADTIFVTAMRGTFDAVVACYHDQGLIPVKLAAFGKAVNVTLGTAHHSHVRRSRHRVRYRRSRHRGSVQLDRSGAPGRSVGATTGKWSLTPFSDRTRRKG